MSLSYQVLGVAGHDNALLVQVDSGQSLERLLFDCGEGCLKDLSQYDIQAIDQLFFSHLHMDHIAGFDSYFRCNFNRETKPNQIWGPPQTSEIIQHRFRGYLWNLHTQMRGTWFVSDIGLDHIQTIRFELHEAFAVGHHVANSPSEQLIWDGSGATVECLTMDHRTPTLAYVVREKPRWNVDLSRVAELGLRPGPWLKLLKEALVSFELETEFLEIEGTRYSFRDLQQSLLVKTSGSSIAYLTDFLLDESSLPRLSEALRGCNVVVCESQYRHADLELAHRNYHMTTVLAATLARQAEIQELVLFHLSDRYPRPVWQEMLQEARAIFPQTNFPGHWKIK